MENQEQTTAVVIGQVELAAEVETLLAGERAKRKSEFLMEELTRSEKDIWSKQINLVYVQQQLPKFLADMEEAIAKMDGLAKQVQEIEAQGSHKRVDRELHKKLKQDYLVAKKAVEDKEDRIATTEQKIKSYEGKIDETRNYMAFLVENFK